MFYLMKPLSTRIIFVLLFFITSCDSNQINNQIFIKLKNDIINNYDIVNGKSTKELDLKYKEKMNGILFSYRLYQDNLEKSDTRYYEILTNNNKTGGRIASNIVWYYK